MSIKIFSPQAFDKRPAAVLFDLDNTLYDYAHPHEQAMAAVREKIRKSLNVPAATFDAAFMASRSDVKKRLGNIAASHSRLIYFHSVIERLGLQSQPLAALDLEQTYWSSFLFNAELFPYAKEVLFKLRALGLPLGLVTDLTTQIQFRKLIHFQIDRYFDYVVTSEEAGADKVDLTPFRLIAEKMKLDQNSSIWFIGDDECDMVGSKKVLNAWTFQKCSEEMSTSYHPGIAAAFHRFKDLWDRLDDWK